MDVLLISKNTEKCKETVLNMVAMANRPRNLHIYIGILSEKEEDLVNVAAPAACKVTYYPDMSINKVLLKLYKEVKNEKHTLQLIGEAIFEPGWDSLIKEMIHFPKEKNGIFSFLTKGEQTYALGIKEINDENKAFFGRGIRASSFFEPVEGLFLHPSVLFGHGRWVKTARKDRWRFDNPFTLGLSAFASGYKVYTANRFVLTPIDEKGTLEGENIGNTIEYTKNWKKEAITDFLQKTEVDLINQNISLKAFLGLGVLYKPYRVQVSMAEALNQRKGAKKQGESMIRPMFVTAWEEKLSCLKQQLSLEAFYNLALLRFFPVTAYGPQKQVKTMQRILPNSFPLEEELGEEKHIFTHKKLGIFLRKCMEQFPLYTHYGWVNMDYLPYPLYEKQAFNWEALDDQKIHIGYKDNQVDPSFFILPRKEVAWFVEKFEKGLVEAESSVTDVLTQLINENTTMFTLYDYSGEHLLLEAFLYE